MGKGTSGEINEKIYELVETLSTPQRSDLNTSVNIKNGETLMLGASRGDLQKGSLITVVTARVVE